MAFRPSQNVVLVYGDSNGSGYAHNAKAPALDDAAWPRLLGKAIKANGIDDWTVHNDSVPGRSLAGDDSSKDMFISLISKYKDRTKTPRFVFILALGTNDLSRGVSAAEIVLEINWYIAHCREQRGDAHIFYLTHPGIVHARLAGFWERRFKGTRMMEQELRGMLSGISCPVLDTHCLGSDVVGDDGLHFTAQGHAAVMHFIYPHIYTLIAPDAGSP